MQATPEDCLLCSPADAAAAFHRRTVWHDGVWRLSLIEQGSPVAGFGHLEPVRHIPFVTDLDGEEAATLGAVLGRVTSVLKQVTGADLVYVYVFGERVPHLHFNLAPHRSGDALVGGPGLVRQDTEPIEDGLLTATNRAVEAALSSRRDD
jgi:diadenosine tetraphosphate (Ap4A) HIT family hydrolase